MGNLSKISSLSDIGKSGKLKFTTTVIIQKLVSNGAFKWRGLGVVNRIGNEKFAVAFWVWCCNVSFSFSV